jgi:penicillin-binding protein 1A
MGEEPIFGITFDGGFAMAADLPLFDEARPHGAVSVTTADGDTATINSNASFGSLSSGGLY